MEENSSLLPTIQGKIIEKPAIPAIDVGLLRLCVRLDLHTRGDCAA